MKKKNKLYVLRLMKYIHFFVLLISFFIFFHLFRSIPISFGFKAETRYNYYTTALFAVLLYSLLRTYNGYNIGMCRIRTIVFAQSLSTTFSIAIVYLTVSVAWNRWYNPTPLVLLAAVQIVLNFIWSIIATRICYRLIPAAKAALVYRNSSDYDRLCQVYSFPHSSLYDVIVKIENPSGSFQSIVNELEKVDAVFVSGIDSELRNGIAKYCVETGKQGFFVPHIGDVLMQGAWHDQSFSAPLLRISRKQIKPEYAVGKRIFDFLASLIGIIVFSPLMIATAIAIKMHDKGPVIYSHERLTENGRKFKIYKFRSMRVDAENGVALLAKENDDRITAVGKVIRKYRIDELPQLFNILKGDMSIVGPRPERPEIAEVYSEEIPAFPLRLQVKAGLTGYAQIYGKYNTSPYEKLEFDLMYINNMNFLLDLQLIFATISILFKKESTEGF